MEATKCIDFVDYDNANHLNISSRMWVGIHDSTTEGVYMTIEGDIATYLPWAAEFSQPTGKTTENCCSLSASYVSGEVGIYDDICDDRLSFICKLLLIDTPQNTFEYEGSSYTVVVQALPWEEAVDYCIQENLGNLIVLSDLDEGLAVRDFIGFSHFNSLGIGHYMWVGINDKIKEGVYKTVFGDTATYLAWRTAASQPTGTKTENCVCVSNYEDLSTVGFYDRQCGSRLNFVCKKELDTLNHYRYGNYLERFIDYVPSLPPVMTTSVKTSIDCAFECVSYSGCLSFVLQTDDGTNYCTLYTGIYSDPDLNSAQGSIYYAEF
ncbi:C-type mannose receptor 2-like [Saccoglossus kowalevskii]|uniref:Macrophage mannose receptor 1-like n=1 Tax=Saccoglossus kowalevskii TaxID=10224 RepID=A0ABM0GJM6_SACKO|nr:PREDICTED: macrophage mannose receptor 1-like [Saccoglossus kowalevskii]